MVWTPCVVEVASASYLSHGGGGGVVHAVAVARVGQQPEADAKHAADLCRDSCLTKGASWQKKHNKRVTVCVHQQPGPL